MAETRIARAARSLLPPEKDFSVTVTVRNNQLRERREKLGLTQKELAKAAGVHAHYYTGLESLRLPARRRLRLVCRGPNCTSAVGQNEPLCVDCLVAYGTDPAGWALDQWPEKVYWVSAAKKLAKFFACPVEELFPPTTNAIKKRQVTVAVNAEDVENAVEVIQLAALPKSERLSLPSPEQEVIDADFRQQVAKALATLPVREERILRMRFGFDGQEHTYAKIGDAVDVCTERARSLEARALRRLRHPTRVARLRSFLARDGHTCPVCGKRAGYRCETGTWYCGVHVGPLETCACRTCEARRAVVVNQEEQELRREEMLRILSVTDEPSSGERVISCAHLHNAGFVFYAYRAGPQTIGFDSISKICICGYCIRARTNPFNDLIVTDWVKQ